MDNIINNELKEILIRKARGFYYREETVEFTDASMPRPIYSKVIGSGGIKRPRGRPKKNSPKTVTLSAGLENLGVDLDCKRENADENKQDSPMVKRKITTHYVPPDMLAIKMLFENFGEKIEDLKELSDEEILQMKRKILREWGEENEGIKS